MKKIEDVSTAEFRSYTLSLPEQERAEARRIRQAHVTLGAGQE